MGSAWADKQLAPTITLACLWVHSLLPMKTFLGLLLGLSLCFPLIAQEPTESDMPKRSPEEIEKLVAPIALYPDSLVALILPSATTSSDVVLAARYLTAKANDASGVDAQPWSESVKSLAHYPAVVKWMDENLSWTQEIGEAFAEQSADVMNAIQRLRIHARGAGLLADTAQQKILVENGQIYIVPADSQVIYVPRYDPEILWTRRPYSGTFISFGIGFGIGNWLFYDCDWPRRSIWVQHRYTNWVYHPGWRRPSPHLHNSPGRDWHVDHRYTRVHTVRSMPSVTVMHSRDSDRWHHDSPGHTERPPVTSHSRDRDHSRRTSAPTHDAAPPSPRVIAPVAPVSPKPIQSRAGVMSPAPIVREPRHYKSERSSRIAPPPQAQAPQPPPISQDTAPTTPQPATTRSSEGPRSSRGVTEGGSPSSGSSRPRDGGDNRFRHFGR